VGASTVCEVIDCAEGERWNATSSACEACARGETTGGGFVTTCTAIDCPRGARWDSTDAACVPCEPGGTSEGGYVTACRPIDCDRGEFWDARTGTCESCETGTTAPGGAATVCAPIDCAKGRRWDASSLTCVACDAGYTTAGGYVTTCEDVDECLSGTAGCSADAACTNTPGAFSCVCRSGFFGDGTSCTPWRTCAAGTRVAVAGTSTGDRVCAPCVGGFSLQANAPSCTAYRTCLAGQHVQASGTATSDRVCADCAAGSFSTAWNASACTPWSRTSCAAGEGYAAGTTTTDATCARCAAGTYSTGVGACQPCASGYFSAAGARSCNAWSTCSPGQSVSNVPDATTDRACATCAAGRYSTTANAASCAPWSQTECAGGYGYAAGTTTTDSSCTRCLAGTSSFGVTACRACASGSYSADGASSCTPWTSCTAGQYVSNVPGVATDRVCSACAAGTYSTTTNAAACTAWTVCSAGQYMQTAGTAGSNRVCAGCTEIANCASGLTCTTATDQTCATCVTNHSGGGTNRCYVNCAKGSYWNGSACLACPSGQTSAGGSATTCTNINCAANNYWDVTQQSCVACPSGQTSVGGTAASCTATTGCAAGKYLSGGVCTDCLWDQWSSGGSVTSCYVINCGLDRYLDPATSQCLACSSGYYSDGNATYCSQIYCSAGQYWDTAGRMCVNCPAGTSSTATGYVLLATCTARSCPLNTRWDTSTRACVACPTGYTSPGGSIGMPLAGSSSLPGTSPPTDGSGTAARFGHSSTIRTDRSSGSVLVYDSYGLRRVTLAGAATTLATSSGMCPGSYPKGYSYFGVTSTGTAYWLCNDGKLRGMTAAGAAVAAQTVTGVTVWRVMALNVGMDDNVYVVWSDNSSGSWIAGLNRIDTATGAATELWRTPTGANILTAPTDLVVSAAGIAYVADPNGQRIRRIDLNTGTWSNLSASGAELAASDQHLAMDAAGNVYTQGKKISPTGVLLGTFLSGTSQFGIDVVGTGNDAVTADCNYRSGVPTGWA
ncbi:MAG: hypothetical protein RL199_2495, partial [Pseudomonadota bacterium]